MGKYDMLKRESPVPVDDTALLPNNIKGIYIETREARMILLNKNILSTVEKSCVLAEELGHFYTSAGDILDQTSVINRKQERRARDRGYEILVPLSGIVEAYYAGISGRHDLAEFLDVTEGYLQEAIDRYRDKYGPYHTVDRFTIYFEPLQVMEIF